MSAKSPSFKKCWPRCLNLYTASVSQSQRAFETISNVSLHLLYWGLSVSLSRNRCPFKWQFPVGSPVIILRWFLLKLSNFPALLAEMDCQYSLCFLLVKPLITYLETFGNMPQAGLGLVSGCEEACLANFELFHFCQTPCILAPIPAWSCYVPPFPPGIDGS